MSDVMEGIVVSGIQQLGIGVENVSEAWKWYRKHLGMDIKVFDDSATASLMLPYTGGLPRNRHAVLALNMNGGGGFEIWQYTDRIPQPPSFTRLSVIWESLPRKSKPEMHGKLMCSSLRKNCR